MKAFRCPKATQKTMPHHPRAEVHQQANIPALAGANVSYSSTCFSAPNTGIWRPYRSVYFLACKRHITTHNCTNLVGTAVADIAINSPTQHSINSTLKQTEASEPGVRSRAFLFSLSTVSSLSIYAPCRTLLGEVHSVMLVGGGCGLTGRERLIKK